MSESKPLVKIAPNNPVFDLPVLVGIEEKLFERAGLNVQMSAPYEAREKDSADRPIMARLKENLFDCGSADSYNVCEWASLDWFHRRPRGGNIAGLRSAVAAQAILSFEEALQVPRDLADVPVVVQELTGSHYTTIQMLESAVGKEHVKIENGGLPHTRLAGLKNGTYRAVTGMEPFINLGLNEGAHLIASAFYRGGEVVEPDLTPQQSQHEKLVVGCNLSPPRPPIVGTSWLCWPARRRSPISTASISPWSGRSSSKSITSRRVRSAFFSPSSIGPLRSPCLPRVR